MGDFPNPTLDDWRARAGAELEDADPRA